MDCTQVSLRCAYFKRAEFTGDANFGTIQNKSELSSKNIFSGEANFEGAIFEGKAQFGYRTFNDKASFSNCKFYTTTNFENSTFQFAPEFHKAELHQDTSFTETKFLRMDTDFDREARAWRTLKIAMNKTHHHQQELVFFGYELDANRSADCMVWGDYQASLGALLKALLRVIATFFYKILSSYGRSYALPLLWLMLFGFLFCTGYKCFTEGWAEAVKYSIACTFPFAGISKTIPTDLASNTQGTLLTLTMAVHTLISLVLLFLAGLGIRNQFMIK